MIGNKQLVEAAYLVAGQHPPRTPERRAVAVLWVALGDTKTVTAARTALASFANPQAAADPTVLLHEFQAKDASM